MKNLFWYCLQEQPPFDKKQFVAFIKKFIKNLTPKLDAEKAENFKKHIEGATKFLLSKIKDLQLWVNLIRVLSSCVWGILFSLSKEIEVYACFVAVSWERACMTMVVWCLLITRMVLLTQHLCTSLMHWRRLDLRRGHGVWIDFWTTSASATSMIWLVHDRILKIILGWILEEAFQSAELVSRSYWC